MANSKPYRSDKKTLAKALAVIHNSRKFKKHTIEKLIEKGWEPVDPSADKFTYDELPKHEAYLRLDFG